MTRCSQLGFLFLRGIEGISPILFKGRTSPGPASDLENFKRMEGGASPRILIAWQRAVEDVSPTRSLPTITSMQSIALQGSVAPGLGMMAAAFGLIISRTGKHLGSTLAASMELVLKGPMDVRIQRPDSFVIGSVNN